MAAELARDVPWAAAPSFSSDGRHVIFSGSTSAIGTGTHEVWVSPLDGGPSINTGAYALIRNQLNASSEDVYGSFAGVVDEKAFFVVDGQIWECQLSAPSWQAQGPARARTAGSMATTGRPASAPRIHSAHVEAESKSEQSGGVRTDGTFASIGRPSANALASADGRILVYTHNDPGGDSIRAHNLLTNEVSTLAGVYARPKVSPDGSQVAYSVWPNLLYLISSAGGEPVRLRHPNEGQDSQIRQWTADGKKLVYWHSQPIPFALMDPKTQESTPLNSHPQLSYDGR